jgi:hypothetical protein
MLKTGSRLPDLPAANFKGKQLTEMYVPVEGNAGQVTALVLQQSQRL